jgi:transcriptional regulator with GAF, ATPase, and Fis domain
MKTLYAQIRDPGGHRRALKWNVFPLVLGTQLTEKNQLRDPRVPPGAIRIEPGPVSGFQLTVLDPQFSISIGDLKLRAFDLPLHVPMKLGDTELTFMEAGTKTSGVSFPSPECAWHTVSGSGLDLLQDVRKAALTRLSIYLDGETGTGKELLAKLIHLWSERAGGAFVPINCGAVALSLAESELFGHVKGAFTGAVKDRPGALLQAHGGTLFLDEVGDLPPELQVKLLRFLESGEIRPVGSDRVLHADVRVICATHKPLHALVEEGRFRQDLFFRLASIPIEIPSLRTRPEDIRELAHRFASEFGKSLTVEAVVKLQVCPWPGNVRELRHAIERAAGATGPFESVIHAKDFGFLTEGLARGARQEREAQGITTIREMEKVLILRALRLSNGNRTDAAKILGVARSTLFEMMKRHEIVGPRSNDYWLAQLAGEG